MLKKKHLLSSFHVYSMSNNVELQDLSSVDSPTFRRRVQTESSIPIRNLGDTAHLSLGELMKKFHMHEERRKDAELTPSHITHGYGTMVFAGNNKPHPVPYVCLSVNDEPKDAVSFVKAMLGEKYGEGYESPSLILSITGGAANFSLNHHLLSAVRRGIQLTAERTHAWVVSGGTNTGVMKLTGEIMSKLADKTFIPPVIGIASFGVITNYKKLIEGGGEPHAKLRVDYDLASKECGICGLDHNHNLFMLVDDGTRNEFGREIKFRASFENAVGKEFDAPVVTIVIQGGPGTLDTAYNAVKANTPIVVVDASGQAADVLAYAYNLLHSPLTKYTGLTHLGLMDLVEKSFKIKPNEKHKLRIFYEKALECVENRDLVVVYNLQDQGPDEFDECVLEAIFNSDSTPKNKILQAMFFDKIEAARKALEQLTESEKEECLNDNLMAALVNNKPEFVQLYLDYGARISNLKPTKSYKSIVEAYNLKQENSKLELLSNLPDYMVAIEELYYMEAKKTQSHVGNLLRLGRSKRLNVKAPRGKKTSHKEFFSDRMLNIKNTERTLAGLISSSFKFERNFDADLDLKKKEFQASHMLFLWAICLDKYRTAKMFWKRGDESIINALIASRMLSSLSRHEALKGPHLSEERQKMVHNSEKFETLAVGVLDECYDMDSDLTGEMLHEKPVGFPSDAIKVSYDADSLVFLSHRATQGVLNEDWYGDLSTLTYGWKIAFCYILPFLVPFVLNLRDDEKSDVVQNKTTVEYFSRNMDVEDKAKGKNWLSQWGRKFFAFYKAPFTRFMADLFGHFALCLLFSVNVIRDLGGTFSVEEVVIVIWFAALFLEEIRQILKGGLSWDYFTDLWNQFDMVMLGLYVAGLAVRLQDLGSADSQIQSKTIHAINAIVLWLRFSRYYTVSEILGPKLIMMAEMMRKDVLTFIMLLAIFLIGFGVAAQALLFPAAGLDEHTFAGIFYRPYYQIYGELFLDDLISEAGCIGSTPFSSCGGTNGWLVSFLVGIYVLVTNILLVNLLIAMFNDTYITIQSKAEALWKKQNYELIKEYHDRPPIPAPFILIGHVYLIFRWLFGLGSCCGKHSDDADITEEQRTRLHNFQESATDRYLRDEEKLSSDKVNVLVRGNASGIARTNKVVVAMQEFITTFRSSTDRQLNAMKTNIHDMLDLVPFNNDGRATTPTSRSRANSVSGAKLGRHGSKLDFTSSNNDNYVPPVVYPQSAVRRFVVQPSDVPWKVALPDYSPVDFTAGFVTSQPIWADPNDPSHIHFNEIVDPEGKRVDRTTCHESGVFAVLKGNIPQNPFGRTGMVGRGVLGKWGVNQAADTVVTRWKRAKDNTILERNGKKVLEFVCILRADNNMWAIPGGFVDNGETFAEAQGREFMEEALGIQEEELDKKSVEAVRSLFTQGKVVARIYSEDPRNTDNAWIETTCVNFHDDTGEKTDLLQLKGGDDAKHAKWRTINSQLDLFASHKKLVKLVADYHHAYF
eukprot:m.5717 g.5717  ORF g.5717 m.5717 type:complete len:1485 (+) comp2458_c0_seq1:201-4655(+)